MVEENDWVNLDNINETIKPTNDETIKPPKEKIDACGMDANNISVNVIKNRPLCWRDTDESYPEDEGMSSHFIENVIKGKAPPKVFDQPKVFDRFFAGIDEIIICDNKIYRKTCLSRLSPSEIVYYILTSINHGFIWVESTNGKIGEHYQTSHLLYSIDRGASSKLQNRHLLRHGEIDPHPKQCQREKARKCQENSATRQDVKHKPWGSDLINILTIYNFSSKYMMEFKSDGTSELLWVKIPETMLKLIYNDNSQYSMSSIPTRHDPEMNVSDEVHGFDPYGITNPYTSLWGHDNEYVPPFEAFKTKSKDVKKDIVKKDIVKEDIVKEDIVKEDINEDEVRVDSDGVYYTKSGFRYYYGSDVQWSYCDPYLVQLRNEYNNIAWNHGHLHPKNFRFIFNQIVKTL